MAERHCHGRVLAAALVAVLASLSLDASRQQGPAQRPVFRSSRDLVVVNVVVRDSSGRVVRGLTRGDFAVTEDNRAQPISTFDFEDLDAAAAEALPVESAAPVLVSPPKRADEPVASRPLVDLSGRRLMVLFFDLSSMQPEELARAVDAARRYVDGRISPADVMAIVSLGTSLQVDQDFTADRETLRSALDRLDPTAGTGFEAAATGDPAEAPDTGNAFTPDETEFNIFNIDRRLEALRALTDTMAGIEQKKSLIYFSSGMSQVGLDNRSALRSLVDRAVRANVSIYAADARGLQAVVPGGEARSASVRGVGAFSGRSMASARDQVAASQDTLVELAEDTGGQAFLDRNDFTGIFDQVVKDTTTYYLLGYTSTNPARDGKYRRIRITVNRPDVKLEYRSGYYAPRDFAHSGRDDREFQLQEYLAAELPPTDLPVHGDAAYFRVGRNRYHVPIWLIVPGSAVPFIQSRGSDRATFDLLGVVRDGRQRPVAWIRDTVKLSVEAAQEVRRKNVQYATSVELPAGRYQLKVVVRENEIGTVGSIDTTLTIPNLDRSALKLSSVVLGTLRPAPEKRSARSPLVRDGREVVPNVAHVVSSSQPLVAFFEVYEPARDAGPAERGGSSPREGSEINLLSGLACFRGSRLAYQTGPATIRRVTNLDQKAAVVQLEVPPGALAPGLYTCQVNIIDDAAGTFAFPRFPLYVLR